MCNCILSLKNKERKTNQEELEFKYNCIYCVINVNKYKNSREVGNLYRMKDSNNAF